MAVTGYGGRRTLFDEDQECYRTSSGNRELRFGRGCVQTSAAVDGGRSFPPTPLFSGPSDGERGSRRWSAHQRSRSPPSHRYHHHLQPPSLPFSSHDRLHTTNHTPHKSPNQFVNHTKPMTSFLCNKPITKYISNPPPPSPSSHSRTHSHNQFQSTKTKSQSTKTHLQSDHQSQFRETHKNPNHQFVNIHEKKIDPLQNHRTCETSRPQNHRVTNINENQIKITNSHSTLLNSANPCLTIPLDLKNLQQPADFSHSENKLQTKTIMNQNEGGCNSQWQFSAAASSASEVNTSKQNNFLVYDFAEKISRCSAPNYSVISHMGQTHENLVGTNSNSKPRPTLPKGRTTTLIDMMQFVSDWFDFEEGENDFCDVLGDIIVNCDNSVQEKGNHEQSGSQLGGNSKSPAKELTDSEPSFIISKNNVKNVSNIKKSSNSDGVQNGVQLVGELRSLDKQVIQGEADMLRSGKNSGEDLHANDVQIGIQSMGNSRSSQEKVVDCYDAVEHELSIFGNFIYLEAEAFELASELKLDLVEVQRNAIVESGPHVDKRQTYAITRQHEKLGGAKKLKALGDTSSVVRTIVSTMSVGFENFKFEGERQRQWQIAWSFSTCRWMIVLVPLWLWDAIRRDFSVGVYHSHKPNRGLRSIVVLLVHFPRASTELEVEFFSKKG